MTFRVGGASMPNHRKMRGNKQGCCLAFCEYLKRLNLAIPYDKKRLTIVVIEMWELTLTIRQLSVPVGRKVSRILSACFR